MWKDLLRYGPVILAVFAWGTYLFQQQRALDTRGVTTAGTITAKLRNDTRWHLRRELCYSYRAGAITYFGVCEVDPGFFETVRVRDRIQVTYLPDSPRMSRCYQSTQYEQCNALIITAAILAAVLCVSFAYRSLRNL